MDTIRTVWHITRDAAWDFFADDAMTHGAALAFYTALSFAPLVLLLITIGGWLGDSTQSDLVEMFSTQFGPQAADAVESVVETAESKQANEEEAWWRWIISLGLLFFTASAVFAQLQASLNHIWGVEPRPGLGIVRWIRKRLLSIGMILAILFVLLVALAISAVIEHLVPSDSGVFARVVATTVSFMVVFTVFMLIFKILPDARINWRDVVVGALMTTALYTLGQLVLGMYFDQANVAGSYGGAAKSLIALLVWVYYSALIFFFGAEITERYARAVDSTVVPSEHAQWTSPAKREGESSAEEAEEQSEQANAGPSRLPRNSTRT